MDEKEKRQKTLKAVLDISTKRIQGQAQHSRFNSKFMSFGLRSTGGVSSSVNWPNVTLHHRDIAHEYGFRVIVHDGNARPHPYVWLRHDPTDALQGLFKFQEVSSGDERGVS